MQIDAMVMIRLFAALLIGAVLSAGPQVAGAAEVGRYQVIPGDPMILLDTLSGRTWRFADDKWEPIDVVAPTVVAPPPKTSAQERWNREAEKRRLKLQGSGKPPPNKP